MKPLRVFQHDVCGGMGYLGTYLDQRKIPYEMVYISRGEWVPPSIQDVSGLIFLGRTHSVNDGHAWIEDEAALIGRAAEADVPVMGLMFLANGPCSSSRNHPGQDTRLFGPRYR